MRLAILISALIVSISINEKLKLNVSTEIAIIGFSVLFILMDLYELFW